MLLEKLAKKNLISPPKFLISNTQYLCIMGSTAYGVAGESSDWDCYGWCIPHKSDVFPHLKGEIPGFGRQIKRFDQWQQHHIVDETCNKEYDFQVFSIVKFFQLCMENNPNMIDSLFVPERCVLHSTAVSNLVRDNRKIFLHRGAYHRFVGYSFSQIKKMKDKNPEIGSKRFDDIQKHGFDVKYGYHLVRLLGECEEILQTGNVTLDEVGRREMMKSIRRGEWTEEQVLDYFEQKKPYLEKLYQESSLPYSPDENKIKELLLECLKMHFGNLEDAVVVEDKTMNALRKIKEAIEEAGV